MFPCGFCFSSRALRRAHQSGCRRGGFQLFVCVRVCVQHHWGLSVVHFHRVCVRTGRLCVFLSQQVRGDVPRLGLWLLPVVLVVVGGFRRAASPLVLPAEAPQFGAPVFPPLEGQSGAVRHQATLLRAPAPLPLLRTDQEEGPAYVQGGAAAAEVPVGDPEGLEAPANAGGGPRAEDGLDWDRELPPGTWTLHPSHLHLQHWGRQRCIYTFWNDILTSFLYFFFNSFNLYFKYLSFMWHKFGFIHQICISLSLFIIICKEIVNSFNMNAVSRGKVK